MKAEPAGHDNRSGAEFESGAAAAVAPDRHDPSPHSRRSEATGRAGNHDQSPGHAVGFARERGSRVVAGIPGDPNRPATEAVFTIAPDPCFSITGST